MDKETGLLGRLAGWLNVKTSPVGCTAVDARKLREFNHGLAIEISEMTSLLIRIHKAWASMDPTEISRAIEDVDQHLKRVNQPN